MKKRKPKKRVNFFVDVQTLNLFAKAQEGYDVTERLERKAAFKKPALLPES
jgi:hypothetical protein